jgi:sn-2 palmitoyl-lipid 9-desaturase
MEKISSLLSFKLINWRLIDKNQLRLFILMHLLAVVAVFNLPSHWFILLFACHALVIGLGITLGFHRLLSHRSYFAPRWLMRFFALLGTLALQGGVLSWCSAHRSHHAHTDLRGDPHSIAKGRWWSHIAWAVYKGPNGFRYKQFDKLVHDLHKDPVLVFLERFILPLNFVLFAVVLVLFGWQVALLVFPLRLVIGWHCTFFVNSLAHDKNLALSGMPSAKNVFWISLLTFGEGFHENHHRRPGRPNFSRGWSQPDFGFWVLKVLHSLKIIEFRGARA